MDNLEPITRNEMFLNGDDLEPITREEMILAGADLEPITRHEWFLKKYRGGGGGGGYDLVNIPDLPADIASFNDGTDLPMASLKVTVTPYQDLSHGDPSPENICPISGWDEAVVSVSGINVWDEEWESGNYNPSTGEKTPNPNTIRCKNLIPCKPNTTYYNKVGTTTNVNVFYIVYYDAEKNYVGNNLDGYINRTFTTPNNACFMSFFIGNSSYPCTTYNNDISINYPSTDTEYHAYNGHTYTIDLDGTRYGGTLDVTSGELVVDRAEVDLGSLSWSAISTQNGVFGATVNGLKTYSYGVTPDMLCSIYKITPSSYNDPYISANGIIWAYVGLSIIRIKDTAYSDATTFKASVTGQQLVYELATPITVQLALTPVKSLEGENNISANCGQITEGKYFKRA